MSISELSELLNIPEQELSALAESELARRRQAEFLLTEPWLFHRDVLCDPKKVEYLRPFHKEGLDWINRPGGKRLKLLLWPRGHLKSTIFTQGESARRAIANPNLRVLVNASKVDLGKPFLSAIKGYFADQRLSALYGNLLPHSKSSKYFRNNEVELTLLSRTNLSLREPTISVSGLDATKTSQHYDLIFHDDLVMRENVGTPEQMDKVWKVWQDSLDLLEPDGTMVVIGTRWHPLDLYGRILSDYVDPRCFQPPAGQTVHIPGCSCQFDVHILVLRDENGAFIFDSKFDEAIASQLVAVKGLREFNAQYLNNPATAEGCWFNEQHIRAALVPAEEIDSLRSKLTWYMVVDPAESLEQRSSFTAIVCVGVNHQTGVWYVDYARQLRCDTAGFITAVFSAVQQMNPHVFGMEKKTRKALEYVLKDKMAQFGRFFTIEDCEPMMGRTYDAKGIRIRSLKPLLEHGRLFINETLRDLINILYTAPSTTTLDLADALSYVSQLVPKGLGADSVAPSAKPSYVLQNKGLQYAVSRKSHRGYRSGTQSGRYGLSGFCRSVFTRRGSILADRGPAKEAVAGIH